jgi:glutamyl-tRNA synthetase
VAGAAAALEADLSWTGLPPDESPLRGGPHGPYRQSERLALYHHHVEELLARGAAYRCFCSEKRLELLRKEAARSRAPNRYDGKCAHLSAAEIAEKMERGVPHTVRFKLQPFTDGFKDLVYGPVAHDVMQFEGKDPGKRPLQKMFADPDFRLRIQLGP